jgi:hypothetical protein
MQALSGWRPLDANKLDGDGAWRTKDLPDECLSGRHAVPAGPDHHGIKRAAVRIASA